jgi:hypothetical protein
MASAAIIAAIVEEARIFATFSETGNGSFAVFVVIMDSVWGKWRRTLQAIESLRRAI